MITLTPPTKQDIIEAIAVAFDWHDGGGSPFYQFASTRKVHSEQHRARLLEERKEIIQLARSVRDLAALASLEAVVTHAIVGQELISKEDWLGS